MSNTVYYILCAILSLGVLSGIAMLSKVKTAVKGNLLSCVCVALAIIITLLRYDILSGYALWISMAVGTAIGLIIAAKVKMIQMPQMVALLNGFGGAASAFVAILALVNPGDYTVFAKATGAIALVVGMVTLLGSLVAAGKLHKLLSQKPVIWQGHQAILKITVILLLAGIIAVAAMEPNAWVIALLALFSAFFGTAFAIRVGGADMPITISLLNSLSGVAGAIAGMAIGDPLLVVIGGIVGASGLLLTQIMCNAMKRSLADILLGKTSAAPKASATTTASTPQESQEPEKTAETAEEAPAAVQEMDPSAVLKEAQKIIIIPGYGMALAQAQHLVKQLSDQLEAKGADVRFAIHPVAGRMPGHMNVLLCEADVPYEKLYEMETINPEFEDCDAAVIIGANDVVNPAARNAEGTPIYGMPVLAADRAKHVIICNYDLKPGYAGVENPLYTKKSGVSLLLGDASETLNKLIDGLSA